MDQQINATEAVNALRDCHFRVNLHWEALLTRLGLLPDQLVPLRQVALTSVAYNALTQGIDTVTSTVQPITWRMLIAAVRGIGENVTADEIQKKIPSLSVIDRKN